VKSSDNTGAKMNYKPGELKRYGQMFIYDATISYFKSFDDVEMRGSIDTKKEFPFLLKKLSVRVELYFLLHEENNRFQRSKTPEIYLFMHRKPEHPFASNPKTL
jgi:hypothetical protein